MTDEELIAEARSWPREGINEGPLINALADRLERAEKVIADALNHDPLHGAPEGLHCCGGMAPCIRRILSGYEKRGKP